MTCRELTEFLMDYLDGALPSTKARRFDEHLAECAACRDYLATYRETTRLIRSEGGRLAVSEMPDDLVAAILDARKS